MYQTNDFFSLIRTGDGKAEEKIDEIFQALIAEQEEQGKTLCLIGKVSLSQIMSREISSS